MSNKIFKIALFALPLLLLLSCSCGHLEPIQLTKQKDIVHEARKSFVRIDVGMVMRICDKKTKTCETERAPMISGSGFVIAESPKGGTYVISAAHVCRPPFFQLKSETKGKKIDARLEVSALTKEKQRYSLSLIELDRTNDLCMLYGEDLKRPVIKMAKSAIEPGEKTLNIAAPRGILHGEAPLLIEGIYNGISREMGKSVFTMLVAGGSSGSVILNNKGEAVGMVSMMDTRFPFVVYSPTQKVLRDFVNTAMFYHAKSSINKKIEKPRKKYSNLWEKVKDLTLSRQ